MTKLRNCGTAEIRKWKMEDRVQFIALVRVHGKVGVFVIPLKKGNRGLRAHGVRFRDSVSCSFKVILSEAQDDRQGLGSG
jgi:hypothetical protein